MLSRTPLSAPPPPPPQSPKEAQSFEFSPSPGLRPQLLVFPNIMREDEAMLEPECRSQQRDSLSLDHSLGSGFSGLAVNNNMLSPGDVPQQNLLDHSWGPHPPGTVSTDRHEAAELCRRHRLITATPEWPLLSDRLSPLADSKWGCGSREGEGAVFELAQRFGELGVGAVPKMLFKTGELQCSCQGAHGPIGGAMEPGDDPTETSDALLVLEGLGNADVAGLGLHECPEDEADDEDGRRALLFHRKREIVQKMSGAFSFGSFQAELRTHPEAEAVAMHLDAQVCSLHRSLSSHVSQISPVDLEIVAQPKLSSPTPVQSSPRATSPNPSQASTPRRPPERCASAPRTPTGRAGGGDKMLKVPGKSRKSSLKIRLSKLFRTKSCSGSSHLLDKRPSVACSISSAGSLMDMASAVGPEQEADR